MAGFLNPYTRTQFAVFLPTPGNVRRSPNLAGTLPLYFSTIICDTSFILAAFTL
jgi:hypothetical protein